MKNPTRLDLAGRLLATTAFTLLADQAQFTDVTTPLLANPDFGHGIAWVDFDGDGDPDLTVANSLWGGNGNRLFRNDGPAGFVDVTPPTIATTFGDSVAWADYDNDGRIDLFIASRGREGDGGRCSLFRNDGNGAFTDMAGGRLREYYTKAVWGDFDNDGWVDLYLAKEGASLRPGPNTLMRNLGGYFEDVTAPILKEPLAAQSGVWGDYDNDGDLDLFVVNDSQNDAPSRLLRNNGAGVFIDATRDSFGIARGEAAAWADYDNDGDLDLLVASSWKDPCRLFRNDAQTLVEVTSQFLPDLGAVGGAAWADYDNDGDLDLFLAKVHQPNTLLRNDGASGFRDVTPTALAVTAISSSAAWGDYDNDGDLDLYVSAWMGGAKHLYRNDLPRENHWLQLDLEGTRSNRSAIGARVSVSAGGQTQIREISGGGGSASQDALTVHFGLGTNSIVNSVLIRWPSGTLQTLTGVGVNQRLRVVESGPSDQLPVISSQPIGREVHTGEEVRLSVVAWGTGPLTYRWRKDGADLLNATNATLVLTNVRLTDAGDYTVVVSNGLGMVTSAGAKVAVEAPNPFAYDACRQFSLAANPNGPWSWGWSQTLGSEFRPHPAGRILKDIWVWGSFVEPDSNPSAIFNATDRTLYFWPDQGDGGQPLAPGELVLHPGPNNEYSIVRWSAPRAGTCSVAARFYWLPPDTPHSTDVHVIVNGVSVFDDLVNGAGDEAHYHAMLQLGAGDSVDFAVGWGDNGNYFSDSTRFSATITMVDPISSYIRTDLAAVGAFAAPGQGSVYSVATSGTRALVSAGDAAVVLLELKDPAKPGWLGTWESLFPPSAFVLAGNTAFIASYELDFLSTVEIVDFTDPAQPVSKGYYDTEGYVLDLAVAGNRLYVADDEAGLAVVDLGNPARPVKVGGYTTKRSVQRVAVAGRYAYVADESTLLILDVSDSSYPFRVGLYDLGGPVQDLQVNWGTAYVLVGTGPLEILDVSDPGNVRPLGTHRTWGVQAMTVAGKYAYLTKGSRGLEVVDLSDPAKPVWVTGLTTTGRAEDVAVLGPNVLVAGADKGLLVYHLEQQIYPPLAPPVVADGLLTLSWLSMEGVRLQRTSDLVPAAWEDVAESEGTNVVRLAVTGSTGFFRLAMGRELLRPTNLVWIEPGTFVMGSPDDEPGRWPWEGPQVTVTISRGFWIGRFEVTQEEYLALMGKNPSRFVGDPRLPVESVAWFEASDYCAALTAREAAAGRLPAHYVYRLPTEAEWEYACRAGTTTRRSYGDDLADVELADYAWYEDNSGGTTHPVGLKRPSPWDLYDTYGNVYEWVQDWWDFSLPGGTAVDPQGPPWHTHKVLKGGNAILDGPARNHRSATRAGLEPASSGSEAGFRVVLAPRLSD